jgi:hypothetical protein
VITATRGEACLSMTLSKNDRSQDYTSVALVRRKALLGQSCKHGPLRPPDLS